MFYFRLQTNKIFYIAVIDDIFRQFLFACWSELIFKLNDDEIVSANHFVKAVLLNALKIRKMSVQCSIAFQNKSKRYYFAGEEMVLQIKLTLPQPKTLRGKL